MKVLTVLKHIFIPHQGNDFKPHFFREVAVSAILFASVFLLGSSFGSSFLIHRTVLGSEIASSVLIDLTNENRIASNYPPLLRNEKLEQAARLKGEDMVNKEYFAHDSPEGVTPWHWLKEVGYHFLYAGENLAINFTESEQVERAWLESPKHRANIMNGEFREIGIATVPGMYNNYPTVYIVQMFGTPAYGQTNDVIPELVKKKNSEVENIAITTAEGTTTLTGDVRGESVEVSRALETITQRGDTVIVKNITATGVSNNPEKLTTLYSRWYERIIFNGSRYIDAIYKVLLLFIAFALVTMIVVEIRKQHYIHIIYGISLLLLLLLFIYINQSFF